MKKVALLLSVFAMTATGDLEIWTPDDMVSSVPLDSAGSRHLVILSQYLGWGYSTGIAFVLSDPHCLPDSFSILDGIPVPHSDYSDTLSMQGTFQQLDSWGSIELDLPASSLPDTLVFYLVSYAFRAEPDSTRSVWVLQNGRYIPSAQYGIPRNSQCQ
ncbi:MAG: hypothetical protein JXR55_06845 [Candidatus Fermentibacteraceae bacterium]|nr:hypothetical protein [Candidatus Fermentibacteraceae bacterium]